MREVKSAEITAAISGMIQEANYKLGDDTLAALKNARDKEISPLGKEALDIIIQNASIAEKDTIPLCQDCGTAIVFLEIGQDVHITDGDLNDAVNEGVRKGYKDGYLRKSIVEHPFSHRKNTGDNTPAVIHTKIATGDRLKISVSVKRKRRREQEHGSYAETRRRNRRHYQNSIKRPLRKPAAAPAPLLIIGLGIGGTLEKAALMAKEALLRDTGKPSHDPETAKMEREVLERVNRLGIGPLGFGGNTTALAVHAETMPTHIASLPVAVNIQCHSIRHREIVV